MLVATGSDLESLTLNYSFWPKILLITVVFQLCFYYNDLYDFQLSTTYLETGLRFVQSLGFCSIILAAIFYGFPSVMLGKGVIIVSMNFLIIFFSAWRCLYGRILKSKIFTQNIIIVGSGSIAQEIVKAINSRRDCGYQVAAIFDNPSHSTSPLYSGFPAFDDLEAIYETSMKQSVRKIVVALEEKRGKLPWRELLRCKMEGLKVVDGISFYESLTGNILVENLRPSWLIFSEGFKKSAVKMLTKRVFGMVISLCGIFATLPLSLFTALCIKLDSRGPIFYSQVRCGEKGKLFTLYKFRSMIAEAEKESGAVWAEEDDPRITKVGRIIRKLRIDEIPQMWNVLRGDMSFVGPRPERPEFVDELKGLLPFYEERMNIKPGITGWAQVCREYGASMEDALEKLKYDLYYIKNMNFFFDLRIMFETVKIIVLGRGAR